MQESAELLALAGKTSGVPHLRYRSRAADPFAEPERVTVAAAFERHAGIDLLGTLAGGGEPDLAKLAEGAVRAGIRVAADDTWSDVFSRVLVERIEPNLGLGRATILSEYPVIEAALARPTARDPRVAERFELYVCGVELANAFGELTDSDEQRRRFEADMYQKQRVYAERYPIDEDFLAALAHMPQASGIALGFDRLVMLCVGAARIDEVVWTPVVDIG